MKRNRSIFGFQALDGFGGDKAEEVIAFGAGKIGDFSHFEAEDGFVFDVGDKVMKIDTDVFAAIEVKVVSDEFILDEVPAGEEIQRDEGKDGESERKDLFSECLSDGGEGGGEKEDQGGEIIPGLIGCALKFEDEGVKEAGEAKQQE